MNHLSDLPRFIDSRKDIPFEWGKNDCCLFAADAVLAMTGVDPAADLRGRYSSALGAKRLLTKLGHADIKSLVTSLLGDSKPRLCANRGDIVLVRNQSNLCLGVAYGHVFVPGEDGLVSMGLESIHCAWSIMYG